MSRENKVNQQYINRLKQLTKNAAIAAGDKDISVRDLAKVAGVPEKYRALANWRAGEIKSKVRKPSAPTLIAIARLAWKGTDTPECSYEQVQNYLETGETPKQHMQQQVEKLGKELDQLKKQLSPQMATVT